MHHKFEGTFSVRMNSGDVSADKLQENWDRTFGPKTAEPKTLELEPTRCLVCYELIETCACRDATEIACTVTPVGIMIEGELAATHGVCGQCLKEPVPVYHTKQSAFARCAECVVKG